MDGYIGRQKELELLDRKWKAEGFSFGVVYGRRRVGKTSLLHKFLEGKKTIFLQSTKDRDYNLSRLSSAIGKAFFGTHDIAPYSSFVSAFSVIAERSGKERIALVIDEISYLVESDKTFLSVLQSFVDQDFQNTGIFLILCGSNMSFIEKDILGIASPVYGRRAFQLKVLPFTIDETASMLRSWPLEDIASAHAITGGIPYYLSFLKEHASLQEAIKAEFFNAGGRLYTEGRLHLMMELRALDMYDRILELMAGGVNEVTQLADKSGKDKSSISQALQRLCDLGIVKRRKKIAGRGIDRGWVFSDRYFAFFYRYVFPYSEMIELGAGDALSSRAIAELPSFTGKGMEDVFQKFILQHSGYAISEIGNVEFPDPESRRNEELDLAVVADDGVMLFGECKWRTEPVGVPIYEELVRRSVIAYPTAGKRVYYLLSRSGFTDELRNISAMSNGHVILIEGRDLIAAR